MSDQAFNHFYEDYEHWFEGEDDYAKGGEIHSYPQEQINHLFGEKSEIKWKHRHPDRWKTYYDIWEELNKNARKNLLGRKEVDEGDLEKNF